MNARYSLTGKIHCKYHPNVNILTAFRSDPFKTSLYKDRGRVHTFQPQHTSRAILNYQDPTS